MKIRLKDDHAEVGFANELNNNTYDTMGEIIVHFPFWQGSDKVEKYEYYVESLGEWVSSDRVFDREERLTIVNKYNTHFLEPKTEADKKRGYEL